LMTPTASQPLTYEVKMQGDRIIREPAVNDLTGLSRTTRWRLERQGKFPARRKLSDNAVGWLESEVRDWIASRNTSHQQGASSMSPKPMHPPCARCN
jgi:prophage regulatory protein